MNPLHGPSGSCENPTTWKSAEIKSKNETQKEQSIIRLPWSIKDCSAAIWLMPSTKFKPVLNNCQRCSLFYSSSASMLDVSSGYWD